MKLLILTAWAVAVLGVVAQPHRHARHHAHHAMGKRGNVYVPGPVETVIVYVLNGQPISEEDVHQGIANGTLVWGDDGNLSTSIAATPTRTSVPVQQPTPSEQPSPPTEAPAAPQSETQAPPPSSSAPSEQSPPQEQPQAPPEYPAPPSNEANEDGGVDREFPNGQYSCDAFPSGYGATQVGHAGLGGWIGIQDPQEVSAAGYDDIRTVAHGSCSDGTCCTPGAFCSYSCPNGYLKASWPELQGATKQSVGGLYCNPDGKLEMASGSIAKTLCVKGTDKVKVMVQNKLSQSESICRTDYPGTESETVPVTTNPGESAELACPDNSMYYRWDNKPTSAQYYINPKGASEDEACRWGDGSKSVGNWAPVNLGVGFDAASQMAYIALFPNKPTNPDAVLDFTVEFVADDMNGRCKYANGSYYFGDNYGQSNKEGCTIALRSGTLNVVLSDN